MVLAGLVVAVAVVLILRERDGRRRPIRVRQEILGRGVYLFTSASCPDCAAARRVLAEAYGPSGFVELSWESEPGVFRELGVQAVPATLIVSESAGSTLYRGLPGGGLEVLSP